MAKERIKREIYVSDVADNFLKKIGDDGGDDMAFAGILFEMAIQMVRSGHITWTGHGFECKTEKGVVTMNIRQPGETAVADKPAASSTNSGSKPLPNLAGIAKSMKAGANKPATPPDDKKKFDG